MALFYVGYLFAVSSTIAFILAILTPEWIYPGTIAGNVVGLAKSYRGIFSVDYGFGNGTCRDWILTYTDSVASCRPRKCSKNLCTICSLVFFFDTNYFSIRCRMCRTIDYCFFPINYSPLACWWLFIHSSSTTRA